MNKNKIDSEKIADDIIDIMIDAKKTDHDSFDQWCKTNDSAGSTLAKLTDGENLKQKVDGFNRSEKFALADKLRKDIVQRRRRQFYFRVSSIAAAIVTISLLVYTNDWEQPTVKDRYQEVISYNKTTQVNPVIVLPNGAIVDMTKVDNSNVVLKENQLTVSDVGSFTESKNDTTLRMNRLIVPSKFTSKIELSDGTVVSLNSDSELSFPTTFKGEQRRVELRGEGYFDVAKSDKMFVVSIDGVDVKVYGTKFNVRGYDKDVIETVLIEGAIGIHTESGSELKLLPNELCVVDLKKNKLTKEDVNVTKYVTWLEGSFMYEKDPLMKLVRELSRWYGVDFVFCDKDIENIIITTIFSKQSELKDILSAIEMLNLNINFSYSEGRYFIRKKF